MYTTYEEANELMAVCLFSALSAAGISAGISLMPADATSWEIVHLHLKMTSGH
jgi:hypothetical protein